MLECMGARADWRGDSIESVVLCAAFAASGLHVGRGEVICHHFDQVHSWLFPLRSAPGDVEQRQAGDGVQ
jgi:hypothetical protein